MNQVRADLVNRQIVEEDAINGNVVALRDFDDFYQVVLAQQLGVWFKVPPFSELFFLDAALQIWNGSPTNNQYAIVIGMNELKPSTTSPLLYVGTAGSDVLIWDTRREGKATVEKCTCPMSVIMGKGCVCGWMEV